MDTVLGQVLLPVLQLGFLLVFFLHQLIPNNLDAVCNWTDHCLGDSCSHWDDCDGFLTCTDGYCAGPLPASTTSGSPTSTPTSGLFHDAAPPLNPPAPGNPHIYPTNPPPASPYVAPAEAKYDYAKALHISQILYVSFNLFYIILIYKRLAK
jgi:hypothetical protein